MPAICPYVAGLGWCGALELMGPMLGAAGVCVKQLRAGGAGCSAGCAFGVCSLLVGQRLVGSRHEWVGWCSSSTVGLDSMGCCRACWLAQRVCGLTPVLQVPLVGMLVFGAPLLLVASFHLHSYQ
jgi:hypothetical protein